MARLYQELLGELGSLAGDAALSSDALREQLVALLQAHRARRPRRRAEIVRDRLIEGVRPARAPLKALAALPWKARAAHPLLEVMHLLHGLYERDLRALPTGCPVPLGRVWRKAIGGEDRERAFAAAEVATLLDLRRALRNGTAWIEHSLVFRSRETLFIHSATTMGKEESRLLDAVHIVADADEMLGHAVVSNGIPLSKIHHAAFDAHLIGIDADYRLHVSPQLLDQNDWPMLEGLQLR